MASGTIPAQGARLQTYILANGQSLTISVAANRSVAMLIATCGPRAYCQSLHYSANRGNNTQYSTVTSLVASASISATVTASGIVVANSTGYNIEVSVLIMADDYHAASFTIST